MKPERNLSPFPPPSEGAFELVSPFVPTGDQPAAIAAISENVAQGIQDQVLLGVTGSGKTFTMANVIAKAGRPALTLLLVGATLIQPQQLFVLLLELDNPRYLFDTVCQEKVNNGWVTVPTMSDSINAVKKGVIDLKEYDFSHVTGNIVIGAQPVPSALFQDMKKLLPFKTGNIYGITEGGGGGTLNLYDADVLSRPGSIGKPTYNVAARVVDDEGVDVPEIGRAHV